MVGNEQQSEDLVQYLLGGYESDPEKLWESNIFGRSVFELVNEGLNTKLKRMPEDARYKLKDALTKIINNVVNAAISILSPDMSAMLQVDLLKDNFKEIPFSAFKIFCLFISRLEILSGFLVNAKN